MAKPAARLLAFLLLAALARAEPELVFQPAAVAFGRQAQNQALVATVRVTNPTAGPLRIKRIESDCACTSGELTALRLAPGASAELTVRIQTGALEGDFRHSLFLVTDRDRETLLVSAEIYHYRHWAIAPSRLIFAPSPHGQESQASVRLDYRGTGAIPAIAATTDSRWIMVDPPRRAGSRLTLTLRKLAGAPSGSVLADLTIATGEAVDPVLTVPVFAYVTSTLSARPNPVIMPVVAAGVPSRTAVEIIGWEGPRPLRASLSGGQADLQDQDVVTLTLVAPAAGTTTHQLEIYDGDDLMLTVPVIERTAP